MDEYTDRKTIGRLTGRRERKERFHIQGVYLMARRIACTPFLLRWALLCSARWLGTRSESIRAHTQQGIHREKGCGGGAEREERRGEATKWSQREFECHFDSFSSSVAMK